MALESGSDEDFRSLRTAEASLRAMRARCWRTFAADLLAGARGDVSYSRTEV